MAAGYWDETGCDYSCGQNTDNDKIIKKKKTLSRAPLVETSRCRISLVRSLVSIGDAASRGGKGKFSRPERV